MGRNQPCRQRVSHVCLTLAAAPSLADAVTHQFSRLRATSSLPPPEAERRRACHVHTARGRVGNGCRLLPRPHLRQTRHPRLRRPWHASLCMHQTHRSCRLQGRQRSADGQAWKDSAWRICRTCIPSLVPCRPTHCRCETATSPLPRPPDARQRSSMADWGPLETAHEREALLRDELEPVSATEMLGLQRAGVELHLWTNDGIDIHDFCGCRTS